MRPSLFWEYPSSAGDRQVTKAGHPKQYLTHAHSHMSWAVAAMHSCLALIGAHQHGLAITRTPVPSKPCSKAYTLPGFQPQPCAKQRRGIFHSQGAN